LLFGYHGVLSIVTMDTPTESLDIVESTVTDRLGKIRDLLKQIAPLAEEVTRRQPARWGKQDKRFKEYLEFVEREYLATMDGGDFPTDAKQTDRFAALLRGKREAAGLSCAQLAKLAGVTRQTIDNIEQGRITTVSRSTMQLLRSVPQLNLQSIEIARALRLDQEYNCHIPATYDTVGMISDLAALLNGPGCHIEQTNAYLDHRSAMVYISDSQNPTYVSRFRETYPSKALAQIVIAEAGQIPLKVIALGPGDGHLETRFMQHLLGKLQHPQIKLVLFDISNALLTCAHKYTKDLLQDRVETVMVQGNFHDLAKYPQVTSLNNRSSSKQKRIYLMMGNTLANLDNEPRFFEHSLNHCAVGDFLILDFQKRTTPVSATEAEIRRNDSALSNPFPAKQKAWLSIPIQAHCPDLISCQFSFELSREQCPIAGSYMIDNIATVKVLGQPEKRFSMFRHKRYDEVSLRRSLERFGWHCLSCIEYGPDGNVAAMLLVKRAPVH